jgi:hypothetical protein
MVSDRACGKLDVGVACLGGVLVVGWADVWQGVCGYRCTEVRRVAQTYT